MDGNPAVAFSRLDVSELRKTTLRERLAGLLFRPSVFRVLRRWKPIVRVFGITAVTRFDDMRELLEHDQIFHVEGARIRAANAGHDFLLGMQDDATSCPFHKGVAAPRVQPGREPSYREYQQLVMHYFRREDLPRVAQIAQREAQSALRAQAPSCGTIELDAVQQLLTHVPIEICRQYYGVEIPDARDFANCTFATSRWLFDPIEDSRFEALGMAASKRINALIEASLPIALHTAGDTIIARLLGGGVDRDTTRVIVFGMMIGFVPTNTMASGHMLEVLLAHPEFMLAARQAADPVQGDDERLKRCLFEAMRFKPLLRDPLRVCSVPYVLAEGTGHARPFVPGERVVTITSSAMMDEHALANPETFDPNRPAHLNYLFGHGLHRCIGAALAEVQITETLKPLLQQPNLRRAPDAAGQLQTVGPFPEHLRVRFDKSV